MSPFSKSFFILSLLALPSLHAVDVFKNIDITNKTGFNIEKKGWTIAHDTKRKINPKTLQTIVLTLSKNGTEEGAIIFFLQFNIGGTLRLQKTHIPHHLSRKIIVLRKKFGHRTDDGFGRTIYKTLSIIIQEKNK